MTREKSDVAKRAAGLSAAEAVTDLSALPGVLEPGLFVDLADEIDCSTDDGVRVTEL